MKLSPSLALAAVGVLTGGSAFASALGFNLDPAGAAWDRSDPGTGYVLWDIFPSTSYTNDAPDEESGVTDAEASQTSAFTVTNQGAGLFSKVQSTPVASDGDVLFTGGNKVAFDFSGTVDFTIRGLVFQAKRAGSVAGMSGTGGITPMLSINGGALIPADGLIPVSSSGTSGDTSSDAGSYSVSSWYWGPSLANLSEGATNTFAVSIATAGPITRSIDGMSVDLGSVSVIPEPASAALLGIGMLFGARRLRRTRVA